MYTYLQYTQFTTYRHIEVSNPQPVLAHERVEIVLQRRVIEHELARAPAFTRPDKARIRQEVTIPDLAPPGRVLCGRVGGELLAEVFVQAEHRAELPRG